VELSSHHEKADYPVEVKTARRSAAPLLLSSSVGLAVLLLGLPAYAHFTMLFSGASGQPASWQEGAFTVTGNWTPDAGITVNQGLLETGSWLAGGDYIASYQGQNSNWLEFTRQGVPFSPLSFEIAERSGSQTFIASTGAQLSVTGAVGDLFFFPANDLDWMDLDWLVLYTSTGSLGIDNFSMNVCPDPTIWGPYNVAEGGAVMMYSYAEGSNGIYNWDLDGDGSYDDASGVSTLFNASVLNGPDSRTVGLEVTSDCGLTGIATGTTTTTVNIANVAPSIDSLTGDTQGGEGETLSWTLTWSDPGTSDTHTITWDPGDGTGASPGGDTFTHSYADEGSYTLDVVITDSDGSASTDSLEITVANQAPVLSDLSVGTGSEEEDLTFSVTVQDPGANDSVSYHWDFGDGSTATTSTVVQHAYADDGSYTVTFTATDNDGAAASISAVAVVNNLAPVIDTTTVPASGDEGETIVLSATASDVPSDSLSYTWDFGDGSPQQVGNPISYAWSDNNTYTVTLTVRDDGGAASSTTAVISINNLAPTITQINIPTGPHDEGDEVLFSVQANDAGSDTLSYHWDLGDGSAPASSEQVIHTFEDEGSYTITLSIDDGDGGTAQETGVINVVNVAPQIIGLSGNSSGLEAQPLSWSAQVSDPGSADVITGTWDFGDGSPTSSGLSASHTYLDNGVYTLHFTASDNDGASSSSNLTVTISNEGPSITSVNVPNGNEGETLSFSATAIDAGDDTLIFSWDFGDSSPPAIGSTVSHAFPDDGSYSVTLTVTDEDNGSATAIETAVIANLPPQLQTISGPTLGDEGQTLNFSGTAIDPSATDSSSLLFTWDLGDGTPAKTGANISHAYPDDGSWQVSVTVADGDGGTDSGSLSVTTSNVAPTFTSQPPPIAIEGIFYSYLPWIDEPGDDSLSWNLAPSAPTGMVLDQSNGRVTWTPEYSDTVGSPPTITLFVSDDDGGMSLQSWTPSVLFEDLDGDGLSDSWEILNGLDPSLNGDELLDPDDDGLTNLDEFLSGTDPHSFDGPQGPLLLHPEEGAEVETPTPWLEIDAAIDPQGDELGYEFEVFGDAALSQSLALGSTEASDDEPLRWKVSTPLPEDTTAFWRVRAHDGAAAGTYSALGSFFVNQVNQRPEPPQLLEPADGARISDPLVTLQWLPSEDVDRDVLTYLIEVREESGELVEEAESAPVTAEEGGWTEWQLSSQLIEDLTYSWRVAARDEHGAQSDWTSERSFQLSQINTIPSGCELIAPHQGQQLEEVSPTLIADYGQDIDGQVVEVLFEMDTSADLGTEEYLSRTIQASETGLVQWDMSATGTVLPENRQVFARLRCFDTDGASSTPHLIDFFVRGENEAPYTPTALNPPPAAELSGSSVLLEALGHGEPEGDLHFFEFVVARDQELADRVAESGPVLPSAEDEEGNTYVAWPLTRVTGELYWSVSGIDDRGARSSWSPPQPLSFLGEPEQPAPSGCCGASLSGPPSAGGSLFSLLVFALTLLRRKRGRELPATHGRSTG